MRIVEPQFELRNQRCTCCDGQGELVFSTCPTCGLVVLICAEVGTVFEIHDLKCGSAIGYFDLTQACIRCGKTSFSDFRSSTTDEILALGFQPEDFK